MSLVWIDCEMTGLDVVKDTILEIACVITTANLEVLASTSFVIGNSKKRLDAMDSWYVIKLIINFWCTEHHGESGLTDKVLNSKITLAKAESEILKFIKKFIPNPRTAPLAGNSVHMDKIFMIREMPLVIEHLHYRIVDVSTVKELCERWNSTVFKECPEKKYGHRAVDDIFESIQELKYYRENLFKYE